MTTKTGECRHCGKRFPVALRQGKDSRRARAGRERTYQDQIYCSGNCRKAASKERRSGTSVKGLISRPSRRLKAPEGSKPFSGVAKAVADDFRGWFAVTGPELAPNQFHCAIVGAREAVETVADINKAHWKAARAGDRGYRLLDAAVVELSGSDPAAAINAGHVASLIATIPSDLSIIPPFLDRRPLPLQRAA
jgi:hypothetical protein